MELPSQEAKSFIFVIKEYMSLNGKRKDIRVPKRGNVLNSRFEILIHSISPSLIIATHCTHIRKLRQTAQAGCAHPRAGENGFVPTR